MDTLEDRFLRDRRRSQRHNVKTALRVRIRKSDIPEQRAESINLSERGIFFATDALLRKGDAIEILLKMPQEITGQPPAEWRCTGLIVRVQPVDSHNCKLGVGVRFDCYEVSRPLHGAELESSVPHAR
jgi:Tfp pilus assembly protein PilZ